MLLGKKTSRADIPCATCSIYEEMGEKGRVFLKRTLLRERAKDIARRFLPAQLIAVLRKIRLELKRTR